MTMTSRPGPQPDRLGPIPLTILAHCPACRRPFVLDLLSQADEVEDGTVSTIEAETYPLLEHLSTRHGVIVDNAALRP